MAIELGVLRKEFGWQNWPFYLGGAGVPAFGILLGHWLPSHIAFGVGAFITWLVVGFAVARRSRRYPPNYAIPAWLVAALTATGAGLAAGVMAYYVPLK